MKKTYISPIVKTVNLDCQGICEVIAVSGGTGDGTQLVKGEYQGESSSTSRDAYNVWDDDWSK